MCQGIRTVRAAGKVKMDPATYTNHAISDKQVCVYINSSCGLDMVHRLHIVSQHNADGTMLLGAGELPDMHVVAVRQYLGIKVLVCHLLTGKLHSKEGIQNAYQLDTTT